MKNLLIAGSCMFCVMAILTDVALASDENDLEDDSSFSSIIDLGKCNNDHVDGDKISCNEMYFRLALTPASKTVLVKELGFLPNGDPKAIRNIKVRVPGSLNGKQVKIGEQAFKELSQSNTNIVLEFYKKEEGKKEEEKRYFTRYFSLKILLIYSVDPLQ